MDKKEFEIKKMYFCKFDCLIKNTVYNEVKENLKYIAKRIRDDEDIDDGNIIADWIEDDVLIDSNIVADNLKDAICKECPVEAFMEELED